MWFYSHSIVICVYIAILFQSALRYTTKLYTLFFFHENTLQKNVQQTASNHWSDIEFKDFMNFCKDYTKELFLF